MDIALTSRQEQIFLGTMFGDGMLRARTGVLFSTKIKLDDKDYVFWKYDQLKSSEMFHRPPRLNGIQRGPTRKPFYILSTKQNVFFEPYYRQFYHDGRKRVPAGLLEKLNELGMAVWYQDDGSFSTNSGTLFGRIKFSTQCFPLEDQKAIVRWIDGRFGLRFHINRDRNYFHLILNRKDEVKEFLELVEPFIVPCMSRKLGIK